MEAPERDVLVGRIKQAAEIIEEALPGTFTERDQRMHAAGFAVILKHLLEPHPLQDAIKRARARG